jgi:hypothetical protein
MSTQTLDIGLEKTTGGDWELPDEDTYVVEFLGVVAMKDFPNNDGGVDTSLTLQFIIRDDESEFDGVEFRDYFPLKVTDKNKSGKLWAALWGGELPDAMPKTGAFIGRKAKATVTHRVASNGQTYPKIASVVPLREKKRRAVVQAVDEDYDANEPDF